MELINELNKQETATDCNSFRMFEAVKAGKYLMSVQGSTGHYCSPRYTVTPDEYSRMELALFKGGKWVHINKSKNIKQFPRYNELLERADSLNSCAPVFGYVPVDLLNDLYLFLQSL